MLHACGEFVILSLVVGEPFQLADWCECCFMCPLVLEGVHSGIAKYIPFTISFFLFYLQIRILFHTSLVDSLKLIKQEI